MELENFYISWFNTELHEFQNRYGFKPTHCIVNHTIYNGLVDEFISNHNIIGLKEHKNFNTGEVTCLGVKTKKGTGTKLFYFYKE